MKIGYVGLGNMGSALARRLVRAHDLVVFDLNAQAVAALVDEGATAAPTLGSLGAACDVVFLCLPTSADVRSVLMGEDALASSVRPGTIIVDQTTGEPGVTRSLAETLSGSDICLVDAPVSGGPFGADAGTIAIMVGAETEQFQAIEPVLQAISPNITHAGGVGAGHVAKLVNNLLAASHRALSLEALALAAKSGVDPTTMLDILLAASGRNFFLETFVRSHILTGQLDSGFTLQLQRKDLRAAIELADDEKINLPLTTAIEQFYTECISAMGGDLPANYAAVHVDRRSGTHVVGAGS